MIRESLVFFGAIYAVYYYGMSHHIKGAPATLLLERDVITKMPYDIITLRFRRHTLYRAAAIRPSASYSLLRYTAKHVIILRYCHYATIYDIERRDTAEILLIR